MLRAIDHDHGGERERQPDRGQVLAAQQHPARRRAVDEEVAPCGTVDCDGDDRRLECSRFLWDRSG
jgi:hypothetical protein